MTKGMTAYHGASIFDGTDLLGQADGGQALLVQDGRVVGIVGQADLDDLAPDVRRVQLAGGVLAPGFVDLQVNGGGGVMFNAQPTPEGLRQMAMAHAGLGATSILPTLITDRPETTRAAIAAVKSARAANLPGIIGLHLEGPHLSHSRKGAHDGTLIRPMQDADLADLCAAARHLPVLMITVAPESVTLDQIAALAKAGVILSLGHTDAPYDKCVRAAGAGVGCVTHLFNAMRQLGSRDPGVVGAALGVGALSAGLICDLIHVHPETITLALAAKQGPGRIFLVSDAMAVAGSDIQSFELNNRVISRSNGRLTLADGTLAGADLDLATALRNLLGLGVPLADALAMATSIPASVIGQKGGLGYLRPGGAADFVHLDSDLYLTRVWRNGAQIMGRSG